jgi:hypothetical protein
MKLKPAKTYKDNLRAILWQLEGGLLVREQGMSRFGTSSIISLRQMKFVPVASLLVADRVRKKIKP